MARHSAWLLSTGVGRDGQEPHLPWEGIAEVCKRHADKMHPFASKAASISVLRFPISLICHYSHEDARAIVSSVGKPKSARAGSWCVMAANTPGDGISEVKFLTVAEVAAVMRVSKMTVYRLVHAGDLPAVRVGRSFRVPEDAVNEYLRKSFFQAG